MGPIHFWCKVYFVFIYTMYCMYVHVHTIHTPSFHLLTLAFLLHISKGKRSTRGGRGWSFSLWTYLYYYCFFFFLFFLRSYIVSYVWYSTEYLLLYIHFLGQKEKKQQRVCFVTIYGYIDKEAEVMYIHPSICEK